MLTILILSFIFMIYFAGTETAICSLSPFQKNEILNRGKSRAADSLAKFLKRPHRTLTAILIGNAMSVVKNLQRPSVLNAGNQCAIPVIFIF